MNVGELLDLEENSALLDQARHRWDMWVETDSRLSVVERFDDLRALLATATTDEADQCLLALAMLAAPDGGDDVAAAAALAKALLPGACLLASRLTATLSRRHFRAQEPRRVNELVASQLWLEVRSFPWRRLTRVGGNILMNTRAGVLRECDDFGQLERVDRTWAHTLPVDSGLDMSARGVADWVRRGRGGATVLFGERDEASALEELLDVLEWACANDVISDEDRSLLLCLIDEASRTEIRSTSRGKGNLCANNLAAKVAPRLGVSAATIRRRAARSVEALAAAAPSGFGS
jgi:hypothetical protein